MAKGTLNKVMLMGNLGKDPELKVFEGGNSLARFPIATTEVYTNRNNERVESTEWHNIIMRNKKAEVADKYLKKGDKIFIEGTIKTRSYQDQNGEQKYITEIQALNMEMLGGNRGGSSEDESAPGNYPTQEGQNTPNVSEGVDLQNDTEDDLPF